MTDLSRGTRAYNERMVEIANEVRGKILPSAWPSGSTPDGVLWSDIHDYIYSAMSESVPASGGMLVGPETGRHVRQPLRP